MVVRSAQPPSALLGAIRGAIASVDKDQPLEDVATMQQRLEQSLQPERFAMGLVGGFAVLAMILAAVGIYGVVAYTTARRTTEFGLRMALGADRGSLLRLVLSGGLRLALMGCAIGITAALVATRALSSLIFEVGPRDPLAFLAAIALILLATVLATLVPALRATRVDPIVALRYE
jgi:ABC-type antimicrobial peptide transport system permease subunit